MKVVILAGGLGTRLSEETVLRPKPMVEICGHPILWHIMKIYSHFGFNEFIILTGYQSHVIKDYFINYYTRYSDITIDMQSNDVKVHKNTSEPWTVTMLYTGQNTMTGGRIKKAQEYLNGEPFLLTYGDGVCDLDMNQLIDFHKKSGKTVTLTAVQPFGRFGALKLDDSDMVTMFSEKPKGDNAWINGGFFVCEPEVFDYISGGDDVVFEGSPLENLAKDGKLAAYKHYGFWRAMDTLRDKNQLTELYLSGKAPWVRWQKA